MTDGGVAYLPELDLHWLSLSNTEISDASAASLKQMADLQDLRIDNTRITDSGLRAPTALPNCKIER